MSFLKKSSQKIKTLPRQPQAKPLSTEEPEIEPANKPFPIVGIGASAGGLEAFHDLLQHLPPNTGMAFVLIQHLDPKHESMLASIHARTTRMLVLEAEDKMPVESNHVYVIPPNVCMCIQRGILKLEPRFEGPRQNLPIDYLITKPQSKYLTKPVIPWKL